MTTPWSDHVDRFGLGIKEAKLFAFLSDGAPRTPEECLSAGLGKKAAADGLISVYVCRIRKKVEPHGYGIVNEGGAYRVLPPAPVARSMQARSA